VEKYLQQYAEPYTAAVKDIPSGEPWQQVVVIPVCNESAGILRPLPPGPGRSLMILVVNETEAAPRRVAAANQEFTAEVNARFSNSRQSADDSGLTLFHDPDSPRDVLLVDRFTDGRKFPRKGGVGHARKVGADLAAWLVHQQRVRSPWIHCTDADVRLPQRYFTCCEGLSNSCVQNTAALIYPFLHKLDPEKTGDELSDFPRHKIMQATQLYEYSLRYYVAGLSYARSPYAFHTIGSTLAVNASHYAKVRGFPRRQAGEDFYLLNKLAKVGAVMQLDAESDCGPIEITARLSDRVPFGTGAAVGKIVGFENPGQDFLLYYPGVFDLLRAWLRSWQAFWQSNSCDISAVLSDEFASNQAKDKPAYSSREIQVLIDGLEESGATGALNHAFNQSADARQFNRQMHTWFDAFRTLKLIHYLRDHVLPSICFETMLAEQKIDHLLRHESVLPILHKILCNERSDNRGHSKRLKKASQ
jgi:hypothetical protein